MYIHPFVSLHMMHTMLFDNEIKYKRTKMMKRTPLDLVTADVDSIMGKGFVDDLLTFSRNTRNIFVMNENEVKGSL